jgi:hypothetical protein
VKGGWRKLHYEELHNLYSSPRIIRKIKSRWWASHLASMGNRGMHRRFWWESQKEEEYWESKIWSWIPRDSEPGMTTMARTSSNLTARLLGRRPLGIPRHSGRIILKRFLEK